ncbi:unnamed protein product [Peronospora destructor]|uniref:Uncharacterized protein n=1 Tax=Peronospora destructor TaxID=86335 RepID=A0AAV0UR45_9STRA|nr:unnamed protein product [Peronospora destructor]
MAPRAALVATVASGLASAQRLDPSFHRIQTKPDKQKREGDLVENLPGLVSLINVTHHAGRIALHDSDKNLIFYWHFQAAQDADKAPLIIWLNGGPGCSSLQGLFMGISPLKLVDESTIAKNEHSWYQFANLLFVDQPVGTGMSYTRGNTYRLDEGAVSADFYDFLIKFLQRHSEYLAVNGGVKHSRTIILCGESHAGRWIPNFSEYILKQNDDLSNPIKIRLVGACIGNGWVHPRIQYDYSDYAHGLGLLSFGQVRSLKTLFAECLAVLDGETYYSKSCLDNMDAIRDSVKTDDGGSSLNVYDVRQYVRNPGAYPPGQENIIKYMNKMEFDGVSTLNEVQSLLEGGLQLLFYNGQWDMMCNHYGTEKLLLSLNWSGSNAYQQADKYTWRVQGHKEPAGFAQQGGNLTYVVVAGAGHMVPMDVPDVAAEMLRHFVDGLGFSDKAQSIINTRLNATDLEVSFCYPSSDSTATNLATLSQPGENSGQMDIMWLLGTLIIAVVSSILSVCVTFACLRNKRYGEGNHDIITQMSDDEHIGQFEDGDDEVESFNEGDGDEGVLLSKNGVSERQVLVPK